MDARVPAVHAIGYRDAYGTEYKGADECRDETRECVDALGDHLERDPKLSAVRRDIERAESSKSGSSAPTCESFRTPYKSHRCGNTINLSVNLGNPSHFDLDNSLCVSFWVSRNGKPVLNWCFIMPNASINGSKGVVIVLSHGALVSWDGRVLKHCSSIPDVEDGNEVFGIFVGSTSQPKSKK